MDYVRIPHCATPIQGVTSRARPKLVTSPTPPPSSSTLATSTGAPTSPTKQPFNLPNLLVSSSLNLQAAHPTSPRHGTRLLSTRAPLSLQTITINFRRFVSKSGFVFWLQDRIEEVIMWRKGWKVTCAWMAAYTFLCYFPRAFILLPHILVISILLSTNGVDQSGNVNLIGSEKVGPLQPKEGTTDWYANLQAIQNLMGAVSDLYDAALPYLGIFAWGTSSTSQLLSILCVSLPPLIIVVSLIPPRPVFLCLGLLPFAITHPQSLRILPTLLRPLASMLQSRVQRMVDNDNLTEQHWFADMREVELWENERWTASIGWSKSNLQATERTAWTKGRDRWSDVLTGGEDNVSNLTFTLSLGYEFVETEDWRIVRERQGVDCDEHGWIYTNDLWLDPKPAPSQEWKVGGMTRRRKWMRRIYLNKTICSLDTA